MNLVGDQQQFAAAALVNLAESSRKSGGLNLPSDELIDAFRGGFGFSVDDDILAEAVSILCALGVGEEIRVGPARPYFSISPSTFERGASGMHGWYGARVSLELQKYPILEAFRKLGSRWLRESLSEAFMDELEEEQARQDRFSSALTNSKYVEHEEADKDVTLPQVFASSKWTGAQTSFGIEEGRREQLVSLLEDAEKSLDTLNISNSDKSLVRAYIVAAKALAESPDPPTDLIWEMINRANQLAGISSLFVSIFVLFASVSH